MHLADPDATPLAAATTLPQLRPPTTTTTTLVPTSASNVLVDQEKGFDLGHLIQTDDKFAVAVAAVILAAAVLLLIVACCCVMRKRRRKPKKYGLLATSEHDANYVSSGFGEDEDDIEGDHTLFINSRSKQT